MSDKFELTKLVSVSYNPRIISTEQLERLKASIKEYTVAIPKEFRGDGFRLTTTVTINKNGNRIVGGHQRIKALNSLGQSWIHKDDISWVELEPDSAHEKALNITLNSDRVSGEWNQNKLDAILDDIRVDNPEMFSSLDLGPVEIEMPKIDVGKEIVPEPVIERTEPTFTATQIIDEARDHVEKIPEDTSEQLYPVSYAVTSEQRSAILNAINKCKSAHDILNSAVAITKVCEIWDGYQQDGNNE